MATIIFDVDDTLYDQLIPFRNAFHETICEVSLDEINHLYRLNREKSDAHPVRLRASRPAVVEKRR